MEGALNLGQPASLLNAIHDTCMMHRPERPSSVCNCLVHQTCHLPLSGSCSCMLHFFFRTWRHLIKCFELWNSQKSPCCVVVDWWSQQILGLISAQYKSLAVHEHKNPLVTDFFGGGVGFGSRDGHDEFPVGGQLPSLWVKIFPAPVPWTPSERSFAPSPAPGEIPAGNPYSQFLSEFNLSLKKSLASRVKREQKRITKPDQRHPCRPLYNSQDSSPWKKNRKKKYNIKFPSIVASWALDFDLQEDLGIPVRSSGRSGMGVWRCWLELLPPSWNIMHSRVQNLSPNIRHHRSFW
jgi:hypothetical protein